MGRIPLEMDSFCASQLCPLLTWEGICGRSPWQVYKVVYTVLNCLCMYGNAGSWQISWIF